MVSVTVYTTGGPCVQCAATERCPKEHGVDFTERDLSHPVNAAAREYVTDELGYSQAPVVVVDDEPENHWSGFRPDKIIALAAAGVPESSAELPMIVSSATAAAGASLR